MATVTDLREAEAGAQEGDFDREDVDAARDALDAAAGDDEQQKVADGSFMQIVGGKEPTTQKVRLYGGAIEVEPPEGGFKKGSSYVLRVEVKCFKQGLTDEEDDKTQQVVGCSDERGLKIRGVAVVG